MGSDKYEDEKPQHKLHLPAYRIGKYPVTNAEYGRFIQAGGYKDKRWWTEAGWAEKEKPWDQDEPWTEPRYWDDVRFNKPNQPVVGVSWHESVAYCRWLRAETGQGYRLPTEAEWEKAARGRDGRTYPWGNYWDGSKLNYYERRTPGTEEVGQYPEGASYYGVEDMLGNVLEWVDSKNPNNSSEFDTRGGGWGTVRVYLHAAWHNYVSPEHISPTTGFRCVKSPTVIQ